ncbi:MAG: hypothetical protein PHI28_17920, partial [Mangrovibacterium sp.]|nr:hypothetical protein [Mangrovibacterium sp.]
MIARFGTEDYARELWAGIASLMTGSHLKLGHEFGMEVVEARYSFFNYRKTKMHSKSQIAKTVPFVPCASPIKKIHLMSIKQISGSPTGN